MDIYSKQPDECTTEELNEFKSLVLEGGEVVEHGLLDRIKRADKLIFVTDKSVIGVGAIKKPYQQYKNNVFEKAGVPDMSVNFTFELGWLYTSPSARGKGVGRKLMQFIITLVNNSGCFATTRENNDAMHYLFQEYSFAKLGNKYSSDSGDYSLVLYANKP